MKTKTRNLIFFILLDGMIKIIKGYIVKYLENNDYNDLSLLAIGFLISSFLSFLFISIYDFLEEDLILIENLKEKIEDKQKVINHSSATKKIIWLGKFGNRALSVGLMIIDPIIYVLFKRKGHHKWNGISKKTVLPFFISSAICTISFSYAVRLILMIFALITRIIN